MVQCPCAGPTTLKVYRSAVQAGSMPEVGRLWGLSADCCRISKAATQWAASCASLLRRSGLSARACSIKSEASWLPLGRLPQAWYAHHQDVPRHSGAAIDDIDSFRADPCLAFIVINQLFSRSSFCPPKTLQSPPSQLLPIAWHLLQSGQLFQLVHVLRAAHSLAAVAGLCSALYQMVMHTLTATGFSMQHSVMAARDICGADHLSGAGRCP